MTTQTFVSAVGIALVVGAIALGIYVAGPPEEARARRLDERRIRALQELTGIIDEYWRVHGRLPQSLEDLTRDPRVLADTKDPVSMQEYRYESKTERTYALCADFARQSERTFEAQRWVHPRGHHCFDLEVREPAR